MVFQWLKDNIYKFYRGYSNFYVLDFLFSYYDIFSYLTLAGKSGCLWIGGGKMFIIK